GLVESLSRPGGNITGLTQMSPELDGKRLEILKETVPRLSRVAVLLDRTVPQSTLSEREMQAASQRFGIKVQVLGIGDANAFDDAFRAMSKERAGGLIVISSGRFLDESKRITDLAMKHRLPAIYTVKDYVDAGGLVSYGVNFPDLFRRAAIYVDKLLQGAKPAELPVEQPTKFELAINLKTAKQIGVTIPQSVLYQADKVIKESAGINRHGVADERAAQERSSAPFWLRVMRLRSQGGGRSVDRGTHRPGMELRNHHFGVPTVS